MAGYGYGYFQGGVPIGSNVNLLPSFSALSSDTITDVGAIVAGTIDNGKLSTVWTVEYGLTNAYGSTEAGGTITEPTTVSKALTALTPYTTYHWRIKAINANGVSYSDDQTMLTLKPSILNDGNTIEYDLSYGITKDGNNYVSKWESVIPVSSQYDLVNTTDGKKPLLTDDGIMFDGNNDYLETGAFDPIYYRVVWYFAMKQVSWVTLSYIFDGKYENNTPILQRGTSPGLRMARGGTIDNTDLPIGELGIFKATFNIESSESRVNDNTSSTGTQVSASQSYIVLGCSGGNRFFSNVAFKHIIGRRIIDTEANDTLIMDYIKKKAGL